MAKAPTYKNPQHVARVSLIKRLVKDPPSNGEAKKFWPREMKNAKELTALYSLDFWDKLTLDFKLNSLAWLKSNEGKALLEKRWREYNFIVPQVIEREELTTEKVGEDLKITKPQKLSDFLLS